MKSLFERVGGIRSSLWDAMVECNTDPHLRLLKFLMSMRGRMSVYGFLGGNFKVIYERLSVEDKFIDFGRIHSAIFNNEGRDYFAFYFIQENQGHYFDDKGQT